MVPRKSQLMNGLREDGAIVDYVVYMGGVKVPRVRKITAFILRRGDPRPRRIELRDAAVIEGLAEKWRGLLLAKGAPGRVREAAGRELSSRLWRPVARELGTIRRVLLSADGALHGIPFAALHGLEKGEYMVEKWIMSQVASVVDLASATSSITGTRDSLLLIGDVDYGKGTSLTPLLFRHARPAWAW